MEFPDITAPDWNENTTTAPDELDSIKEFVSLFPVERLLTEYSEYAELGLEYGRRGDGDCPTKLNTGMVKSDEPMNRTLSIDISLVQLE